MSLEAQDFIKRCIKVDPESRLSASAMMQHVWLRSPTRPSLTGAAARLARTRAPSMLALREVEDEVPEEDGPSTAPTRASEARASLPEGQGEAVPERGPGAEAQMAGHEPRTLCLGMS